MAVFFSTWVKIGESGGPSLKKNLENLISNSTSALRVECLKKNGREVFYIRDRNIFDYLWEKLHAYESQLRQMRTMARVAVELKIRPFVEGDVFQGGMLQPLWKKIEQRIMEVDDLNESQERSVEVGVSLTSVQSTVGHTVDQLASISNGLSLALWRPSAVIAGVAFGFNKEQGLGANKPIHVGHSYGHMVAWPPEAKFQMHKASEIKKFYLNALNILESKNIPAFSSIVITPTPHPFEKDGKLSDQHAEGFLMAAKEFIRKRKNLKKPVSLMIVVENKKWYKKLKIEMSGEKLYSLRSSDNAVQDKQFNLPPSPQESDSMFQSFGKKLGNEKKQNQLKLSDISGDEILM